jgi:hypothetical protein
MNQLLEELKSQAEFVTVDGHDRYALPDEFAEQFAKLIIKECINVVKQHASDRIYMVDYIEKHFGVEL